MCAHTSPQPFNTQEEVHVACLVSGVFHLELARLITKVGERQGSEQRLGSDPYRYVLGTSLSSSSAIIWGTILSRDSLLQTLFWGITAGLLRDSQKVPAH